MSELICVGAIAGAFGVRGEVRIKSFCAIPEDIGNYSPLLTEDGSRSYTLELTRAINNGFAANLGGVATKEQADALKGLRLYAPRDRLPSLPDDEFYHADLIGLTAYDTQNIKNTYLQHAHSGDSEWLGKAAIMGALNLYLDFINMFMFLLQLLGNRE